MGKIKVAFFAEILIEDFDGASRTMFQILRRIPRDDFEFMFFCGVEPDLELGFPVMKLPTLTIPGNGTYEAALPWFAKRKLRKALDDFKPDVIHFASPSPLGGFGNRYGREKGIPVVSIYHTHFLSYVSYYFRKAKFLIPFFQKWANNLTHQFYHDPKIVYVPVEEIIKDLKEKAGLNGHNLKLWPRGLDKQKFHPGKKDIARLRKYTENDKPNILFASRLVWEKNLQALIDLYNLCQEKGDPFNFVVSGDGVARKELEQKMPNAHFVGMLGHSDLSVLYASSDIFFFPSVTETYGNVVVEAMASGIPCIVANGGGPKSIIEHGVNGFINEPNDIEGYREIILKLLDDKELYHKMVLNGLNYTDALDWEYLVDSYFEDLRKLVHPETSKIPHPSIH